MRFHLNISRNLTHFAVPPNVLCATFVTLISSLATLGPSHFTWFEQKSKTIQHPCLNNNNPCVKTSFFVNKKENLPALLHPYFLSLLLQLLGSPLSNIELFTLPLQWEKRWEWSIIKGIHELQKHVSIYYYFEKYGLVFYQNII